MTTARQYGGEREPSANGSGGGDLAPESDPKFPIRVVCRRTGLKAATLRAWEKRYRVVAPKRTTTDRRVYTEADIRRLSLLQRAIGAGWRIGQVAELTDAEVEQLLGAKATVVRAVDFASPDAAAAPRPDRETPELDPYLDAVWALDSETLRGRLEAALLDAPRQRVIEEVVAPLMQEIGARWAGGSMRPVHEHFATATVRSFLSSLRNQYNSGNGDHRVIVTTPSGQLHEVGALMAATVAEDAGWAVTYLGPNLPPEEIALAARHRGAQAVVLSLVLSIERAQLEESLYTLRRLLPDAVVIIAGGRGTADATDALTEIGAHVPVNLGGYRQLLGRLLTTPAPE